MNWEKYTQWIKKMQLEGHIVNTVQEESKSPRRTVVVGKDQKMYSREKFIPKFEEFNISWKF